jgi:hypothetical protein
LVSDIKEGTQRARVFENRVLRRIFGPNRDEVTGDWRKLHNEELHNSHSSPSIIRMIKSRRKRWEENTKSQIVLYNIHHRQNPFTSMSVSAYEIEK